MKALRLIGFGWYFQFKAISPLVRGLFQIIWPLFFATVAFFMFRRAATRSVDLRLARRGGDGIWSATSTAGTALQRERWHGTLERSSRAAALLLVLLPVGLATSTIGVYCMAATLLWGRFVFGIDLTVEHRS